MNLATITKRISELEAQREREYDAFLRWLSDEQLQLMIDGLRASMRGEPIGEAAMTHSRIAPSHLTVGSHQRS